MKRELKDLPEEAREMAMAELIGMLKNGSLMKDKEEIKEVIESTETMEEPSRPAS